MSTIKRDLQQSLLTIISDLYDVRFVADEIVVERPNIESHGDFATNIAMKLAGELKRSPLDIAEEIVERLKAEEIQRKLEDITIATPGFINFKLSKATLYEELITVINAKEEYGKGTYDKDETWLLEHTSPNPNKAMHLGHLRNNVTGMAIGNIWEYMGIKVIRDAVDNDRGIAIAKLMWGYLKFARKDGAENTDIGYWYEHQNEWQTPEELGLRPDRFVDELYVRASTDFKENEDTQSKVRQMVIDWENEEEKNWALWERVMDYSHRGQDMTLERLHSKWDFVWHEHEHYKQGKQLVEEGLKSGVFQRTPEGTIITNLDKYKIPNTVVEKSDGTALYITQDLALTKLKKEKFNADKMFWVIGPEQTLAMKQVFAVSEQLGTGKLSDFVHLMFGYMSIKGKGKMSSRAGTVIYIDELIDEARDTILEKLEDRGFDGEEKQRIAEIIGVGAVKYSILKVARTTDTAFDFATSLAFDGNSGPYLVYTYVRARNILQGNTVSVDLKDLEVLQDEKELDIIRYLLRFPEVVHTSGIQYAPNMIADFLFELAQKFNRFYKELYVLTAETEELKIARLALTEVVATTLKTGLGLLGIETVEKM